MFGWRESEKKRPDHTPALERAEQFLAEYANSDQKELYALNLWGIFTAFKEIFGDIDQYQSSDEDRKKRYITLLGTSAIEEVRKGDEISSASYNFFMNYLVATSGTNREEMRGSLEQVSDRLDGIVRFGAKTNEQLAEMEDDAREIVSSAGRFKIGSSFVVGPVTERAVVDLSQVIINDLRGILHTGDDFYWFTIEQHDRLLSGASAIRNMLDELPLFPIEYEGRCSSESYVGRPNPGVDYFERIRPEIRSWCAKTAPDLEPGELSTRVIAAAYGHFRKNWQRTLDGLRLEMARQYRESCVANGDHRSAGQWSEVITALS